MHLLRPIAIISLTAAATACSIPEKVPEGEPLACINQPPPTRADDPVTLAGQVKDSFGAKAVAGATLQAFLGTSAQSPYGDPVTTDSDGNFALTEPTGGAAHEMFVEITANGFQPTLFVPAGPVAHSFTELIELVNSDDIAGLDRIYQITPDPTLGLVLIAVVDCNAHPLGGAVVTTTSSASVHYFDANINPSPTANETDSTTGTAVLANVPPGHVDITVTLGSQLLKGHGIEVMAGTTTQTDVAP